MLICIYQRTTGKVWESLWGEWERKNIREPEEEAEGRRASVYQEWWLCGMDCGWSSRDLVGGWNLFFVSFSNFGSMLSQNIPLFALYVVLKLGSRIQKIINILQATNWSFFHKASQRFPLGPILWICKSTFLNTSFWEGILYLHFRNTNSKNPQLKT